MAAQHWAVDPADAHSFCRSLALCSLLDAVEEGGQSRPHRPHAPGPNGGDPGKGERGAGRAVPNLPGLQETPASPSSVVSQHMGREVPQALFLPLPSSVGGGGLPPWVGYGEWPTVVVVVGRLCGYPSGSGSVWNGCEVGRLWGYPAGIVVVR